MDSSTSRSCSPEIVAPAGNLEKLKIAVRFGADAVYFGGEQFNLRIPSGNFGPGEIAEGLAFCRGAGVKSVFLLNAYLHESDIGPAREYLKEIKRFPFDAVMVSDPGMLELAREAGITAEIHLSTQMSTLNHLALRFWGAMGISRVVLARETTLDEIRSIRRHTDIPLETFAHGALCISYSGRCLLSRYLSGRDANQGLCSHPCRWRYALVEEKRQGEHLEIVEHVRGTEILSSMDLCLIGKLPDYAAAGVNAFKIEGRMKSLYYAANVTRIYRHARDTLLGGGEYGRYLPFWKDELDLVSHRPYTNDLFNEFGRVGFTGVPYIKKALFLGYSLAPGKDDTEAQVKIFNPVRAGEEIEAIFPILDDKIRDDKFTVREIMDGDQVTDMARPGRTCLLKFDRPVGGDAIFRRRLT